MDEKLLVGRNRGFLRNGASRRLVLVGGFLGAGKTTLIARAVRALAAEGVRCGVVTNDQAAGLVDTRIMEALGAAEVGEVAGACFCCRLEELVGTIMGKWPPGEAAPAAPLVVFAEPVGSCTDLMATVLMPLRQVYDLPFDLSPLSVVLDGRRALASLGGRRTPGDFSKDVGYIYHKQIEEAEILVVNKIDAMEPEDLADLMERIGRGYPGKEVFSISARSGEGVDGWLARIAERVSSPARLMDVDYQRYGTGEALLGWCNAEFGLKRIARPGESLLALAVTISQRLAAAAFEVAHFKMALTASDGRIAVVNQALGGVAPEISREMRGEIKNGSLTVNLRAEGDPAELREIVESEVARWAEREKSGWRANHAAAFRPGQPVPTARMTTI